MSIQSVTHLNVDFYDKKYILINAKQYDKNSRFLLVTCYNHGELFSVNPEEHSAYIRYEKSDDYAVFNSCEITDEGKVLVELTEQMLASDGICEADLVIINKGSAEVDVDTGEIIAINNSPILSTMTFHIDVSETSVANSEIESAYEYSGFNSALQKAEAEYTKVIQLSKSYAVGDAGGIRENEDTDNAKYYYEQSFDSASNAKVSEDNALVSEQNAKTSETNASISESNAKVSETNAFTSEQNAKTSETNSKTSEVNSSTSEQNAKDSETNAKLSEDNAKISETNAAASEQNANSSELNALDSANKAQSYAIGGTGTRNGEDTDNASWYYNEIKDMFNGINIVFVPKGTIFFSDLATVKENAVAGYVYNIKDDFITDETFMEGAGVAYTAGTNVYYAIDENNEGKWDCFGGASSPTATVDEVKSYLGI